MEILKKGTEEREQYELICIDDLVQENHVLRKIDAAIGFTHIYELVGKLYCPDNGRPSIDPVVIFKMAMILEGLFMLPTGSGLTQQLFPNL